MKRAIVFAAALGVASTLQAQAAPASETAKAATAASPAAAPAGWAARFDKAGANAAGAKFTTMGDGLHFTTGPSATWYRTDAPLDNAYTVEATFVQTKAPQHPEAYGLMVMGKDLDKSTQSYVYFVVRGTGEWLMKHRANDTEVHTIHDWTPSTAVNKQDAEGKATNKLRVDVASDSVRFFINDQSVKAFPRTYMKDVQGVPGIRMNHGLDVHVAGWKVTKK